MTPAPTTAAGAASTIAYLQRELNRATRTIEQQADEIDKLERQIRALNATADLPSSREILNAWAPWLTRHQTYIVAALAQHGRMLTHGMIQQILEAYGNSQATDSKSSILVRMSQIRKKAQERGIDLGIVTHRSFGYQIREDKLTEVRALLWARHSDIQQIRKHNEDHQSA